MADVVPMLDLIRLHRPLKPALMQAFEAVVDSGCFIGGDEVATFEAALARYVGVDHGIGMSSGTDALLAVLTALGVGPGDEVITTGYSFFATAGSIARLGATPIFVDIDLDTFNIDPNAIDAAITPRTAGIVPVHLFGQCADMDPILAVAKAKGVFVVEDAAQSIGATYKGRAAGTMGTAGIFSFFPAKNLGALGDAGAVITKDAGLAEQIRRIRVHGASATYFHERLGGNFRLDALQAAMLKIKLPHLKTWEAGRERVAAVYREAFEGAVDIVLPRVRSDCRTVNNQFVIRSGEREAVRATLEENGIASAVYYPKPLYRQPCFNINRAGYRAGVLPSCDRAAAEALALPVDPYLTAADVHRIAATVKASLEERRVSRRDC